MMKCVIYKSLNKYDHYLFVEQEDDFSRIPQALQDLLGTLEFVMLLELGQEKKLARADVGKVIKMLLDQGYYLQLPPENILS